MLIKWNLNKTDNTSAKKKDRIKFSGISADSHKIFEAELNEAMAVSKTSPDVDFEFYLENLEAVENKLISNPNRENFNEYRQYVKMIGDKLMKNAFKMSSIKDMRKKQFNFIKIVDENLSQLFNAIMQKSENRDKIISLVGAIKGIILDLKV